MSSNFGQRQGISMGTKMIQNRRTESDPPQSTTSDVQMQSMVTEKNSFLHIDENAPRITYIETALPASPKKNNLFAFHNGSASLVPTPPVGQVAQKNGPGNLLGLPPSGQFVNFSPRPLRRALSARGLNENTIIEKFQNSSSLSVAGDFYGDSISAINVPVTHYPPRKKNANKQDLSVLMSGIYAVFVLMLGAIIFISDQRKEHRLHSEVFSSSLATLGILWLTVFHVNLYIYKKEVLKQLKLREITMQEASDRFSTGTEFVFNSGYRYTASYSSKESEKTPPYTFLQGRHSGSFYLKVGSAAFCFGYLIYQGLLLGQHILNFLDDGKKQLNCHRPSSIVLHAISPLYAFYQLFITFKYSNIVINRHKALARFGLMHLIATCLCNWFSTIVEEAVQNYNEKNVNITGNISSTEFDIARFHITIQKRENWNNSFNCISDSVLSTRSSSAIPYLYPFAIEYNLLLAGVWFIVWQNIGKEHTNANPHHLRHAISQDGVGSDDITYQSNLVISADCHSANKGLFSGLLLLLTTIVSVIVFFVSVSTAGYEEKAIAIHTAQEGVLHLIGMLAVCVSFYQIQKLDNSENPITFLDDVLMFVPLPSFFVHGMMLGVYEFENENYTKLAVHVLITAQVIVQTPFIIGGLRRCSQSQTLRYKKPGRELITFLIILNLTLWIVNTFELKSVEHHHDQEQYLGDLVWLFVGHTTLPLMLFYRFHSSVCLADMWKSAYEKET